MRTTKVYFDWPGYPASAYQAYWDAFDRVGLYTSLQEMLGWIFFIFDRYGQSIEDLERAVCDLYFTIEPRLPKDHEPEYIIEILRELLSFLHVDFRPIYQYIKTKNRRIRVGPVAKLGFFLLITDEEAST